MRDVCDLCGARLYEGEPACRDCGAPRLGVVVRTLPDEDSDVAARYRREGDTLVGDLEPIPAWLARHDADADPDLGPDAGPDASGPASVFDVSPTVPTAAAPVSGRVPGRAVDAVFGPAPGVAEVSIGFELDEPSRRAGLGVALAVAGVLLAGAGVAFMWSRSEDGTAHPDRSADEPNVDELAATPAQDAAPAVDCVGAEALAGSWNFTTEVTTALALARLGIRGFYELDVAVNGCEVVAEVRKLGYTGRTYKDRQIRSAKAKLAKVGDDPPRFVGSFDLRTSTGKGDAVEFRFSVSEGALFGTYRHRKEAWTAGGISGFLRGEPGRSTRRLLPELGQQPCWARCAVACAEARRSGETGLEATLDQCTATCGTEPDVAVRCPGAVALPPELKLGFTVARPRLLQQCKALGVGDKADTCRREPTIVVDGKKAVTPWLDSDAVAGGFSAVHLLETEPRRRGKRLYRLAVETEAGWSVSDALLPPGSDLEDVGLFARDLGQGDRRYVAGFVSGGNAARVFFCRTEEGVPLCAIMEPGAGQWVVPLPGGAVALVSETETALFGLE